MENLDQEDWTVTISKKEYRKLLESQKLLTALQEGGVDNWEWYGEALSKVYDEDEGE